MMFQVEFWHWWALALCFVVIEAIMPSGVFASMALAGGAMGALFLLYPDMTWQAQLGGFAAFTMVLSYITTAIYRKRLGNNASVKSAAAEVMGKDFILETPVQNGFGEMEINGTRWELKGPDIKKGSKVRVIGLDGSILVIRPLTDKNPEENAA